MSDQGIHPAHAELLRELIAERDAAVARAEAAEAAIERVRALHQPYADEQAGHNICPDCLERYPCATIRALDGTP